MFHVHVHIAINTQTHNDPYQDVHCKAPNTSGCSSGNQLIEHSIMFFNQCLNEVMNHFIFLFIFSNCTGSALRSGKNEDTFTLLSASEKVPA